MIIGTTASQNGRRRIAVTGIGCVTAIGSGAEGLWAGLLKRESAVKTITRFDPAEFRSHMAAEANDFEPADYMEVRRAKRLDRFGQFSVASARMALDEAELDVASLDADRVAELAEAVEAGGTRVEITHSWPQGAT